MCAKYWTGFHTLVWTQYHIFAISQNAKTRKVTLCCSSEKHQPNLIIWPRLGYFMVCSRIFHFKKGGVKGGVTLCCCCCICYDKTLQFVASFN